MKEQIQYIILDMNPQITFLLNKALESLRVSNIDSAELYLKQALKFQSNNPHILRLLGVSAAQRKKYEEAKNYLLSSIKLLPKNGVAHSNLGNIYLELREYEKAIESYDLALKLSPGDHEAWSNKGNALFELKQYTEALSCHNKSIELKSDYAEAWSNKGNTLNELKRYDEAIAHYDRAIELKPDYAEAWYNKGVTFNELKRYDEAIAHYDRAIKLKPDYAEAHWNKSLSSLTMGNFKDGWEGYEYRDRISRPTISWGKLNAPRLSDLGGIKNKKILIWSEQGLGDTIQFCRYLMLLKDLGGQITFVAPVPLVTLLESSLQGITFVTEVNNLELYDFQEYLLSLPRLFETDIHSIPSVIPYLNVDNKKNRSWKERLKEKTNIRIGLVWNGGFRKDHPELWAVNERRNISLEKIAILRSLSHIDFFSLQKGDPAEAEILIKKNTVWPESNFYNYASELSDFSDTAAFINNLDLVISVDTSTAHLAAALGKEVWLLNRYDSCWRWLNNRIDSPWYPTLKLYNQERAGDWDVVLERVKFDLENLNTRK